MLVAKNKTNGKIVNCKIEKGDTLNGLKIVEVIESGFIPKSNLLSKAYISGTVKLEDGSIVTFDEKTTKDLYKPSRYVILKKTL